MKTLLTILFLLPVAGYGQCKIYSDKVDEFTGEHTVALKPGALGDIFYMVYRTDSSYYLYMSKDDIGCSRLRESKVMFKFDNGAIVELLHLSSTNCKGTMLVRLDDNLDEFMTHAIQTVRLVGTRATHTSDVKSGKDAIMKALTCLRL